MSQADAIASWADAQASWADAQASWADAQASLKIDPTYPWSRMSKDMEDCGVSVNLTHVPNSSTPLHIVLWKGVDESQLQVKSLLDRITTLESMVAGLLETQRASVWFPQCLRPTPAGLDVISRRESAGNESDFGSLLSNIVRPSAREVASETEAEEDEIAEVTEVEDEAQLEEEDEVVEYKEVEWKGVTYYVDAENQAYQMDSDGDLIDTAIGVWREETKKLIRYKQ